MNVTQLLMWSHDLAAAGEWQKNWLTLINVKTFFFWARNDWLLFLTMTVNQSQNDWLLLILNDWLSLMLTFLFWTRKKFLFEKVFLINESHKFLDIMWVLLLRNDYEPDWLRSDSRCGQPVNVRKDYQPDWWCTGPKVWPDCELECGDCKPPRLIIAIIVQ